VSPFQVNKYTESADPCKVAFSETDFLGSEGEWAASQLMPELDGKFIVLRAREA
jgi:hypothetical protein